MVTCAACEKEIGGGPKLTAGGVSFHSSCFKCGSCDCALAGISYYTVEGKKICKNCYAAKVAPSCAGCKDKIVGEATKLGDGRSFHPRCFKCETCGKAITSSFHTDDKGKFHHSPDCKSSKASASDEKCKDCKRELINVKYFTLGSGAKACADCYEKKHAASCYKCSKPILEGQTNIVKDWKFHAECFKCPNCDKNLSGRKIKLQGGDAVVCFSCDDK